jgi:uncharacterized protein
VIIEYFFSMRTLPRRFAQGLALIANIRGHFRLIASLHDTWFASVCRIHRDTPYKYLGSYLSLTFEHHKKLTSLENFYRYSSNIFRQHAIDMLLRPAGCTLYKSPTAGLELRLELPHHNKFEGELILVYLAGDTPIFSITFSIVPGTLFDIEANDVVFIGCVQGVKHQFALIQSETKNNCDIPPQMILLTAVQAIASSLNFAEVIGVSAKHQVCIGRRADCLASHPLYDDLWESAGGNKLSCGHYRMPAILHETPLKEIKRGHRARTKRKRRYKQDLYGQVRQTFHHMFVTDGDGCGPGQ